METDYYKQPSCINWSLTAGGQNVGDTESAKQIENNLTAKLLPTPPTHSLPNQNLTPTLLRGHKSWSGASWMKTVPAERLSLHVLRWQVKIYLIYRRTLRAIISDWVHVGGRDERKYALSDSVCSLHSSSEDVFFLFVFAAALCQNMISALQICH